ncbi:MAG TPA: ABC transporter substrate-binding protein/permease [Gemmataceae bacterium]|nr:ABC transporter substrate-binding protein/permease [Gemmataceae bacterium]
MPKSWLLVIAATLAAIPIGGLPSAKATAEERPLLWAADAEGGAPYIFKDPKDPQKNIGYEVDIAAALERELGRRIQFKQYEFESIFSGLERGDFDFAMNGLEITPDRKKKVRFTRPYYIYKLQFVTRAGERRFTSLEECRARQDLTIGTLADTAAQRLLDKLGLNKKIYSGQVEPYGDLALGRIDGVLLDLPIALYYAKDDPKLRFAGPPIEPGYYAIALNPRNDALANQLDGALERLLQSGELRRIDEKWGLWDDEQPQLLHDSSKLIAADAESEWRFSLYLPLLLKGAGLTVFITVASMLLAVLLGLPIALIRLYGPAPLRWLGLLYVEFFRGIPVLLLLYFLYYGLPVVAENLKLPLALNLDPLQAAILGLGLNYAAYESEIYRSGIGTLPIGQWEAAASLGMSRALTFRRIILPQAIRVILPPMTNDFVGLFKDTSIVSIITVVELSKEYQILSKSSLKYLEIGLATAALYLIMSVPLGYVSRYLEKRWSKDLEG